MTKVISEDLTQPPDFIGGPMVEEFEKAFADFCGCNHCDRGEQRHRRLTFCAHGLLA